MSLDIHTTYAERTDALTEPQPVDIIGLRANWGERIVTVVATTIAVLIVAVIAVLMGMA
jgi:hypothetical protein